MKNKKTINRVLQLIRPYTYLVSVFWYWRQSQ